MNLHVSSLVPRVLNIVKSYAASARSTAVTLTGAKLRSFFPENTSVAVLDACWGDIVRSKHNRECHVQGIGADVRTQGFPEDAVKLKFIIGSTVEVAEKKIREMMTHPSVSLIECGTFSWLETPLVSAQLIADLIVEKSLFLSAVLLIPFDKAREKQIRECLAETLQANGASEARAHAEGFAIIGPDALYLLSESQCQHMIIDGVHRFGTATNYLWTDWAAHRMRKGFVKSVHLFAASNLAGAEPGYNVVIERSRESTRDEGLLRNLALDLFARRPVVVLYRTEATWSSLLAAFLTQSVRVYVLSRMASGTERRENEAFVSRGSTAKTGSVKHCALLTGMEMATITATRSDTTLFVLRTRVLTKFTLRDWITLLEACSHNKIILLVLRPTDEEKEDSISAFIHGSRMPFPPQLSLSL